MKKHDITKLPVWAQHRIAKLERDVEHYQRELRVGPEDSVVFADPYSEAPRPLGDAMVAFQLGDDPRDVVRVRRSTNGRLLDVNGGDGLMVMPRASNSIEIKIGRIAADGTIR
jgi:hypothetical protein